MATWDDLPIEIICMIADHFNLDDREWSLHHAMDIISLSQVNKLLNEILWQDPEFYERLWRKYVRETLPKVPPTELRDKFYGAMRNIENNLHFEMYTDYERVSYFAEMGYTYIFEDYFDPDEFKVEEIHKLFSSASKGGYLRIMNRLWVVILDVFEDDVVKDDLDKSLVSATEKGRLDTIQWLIEKGADVPTNVLLIKASEKGQLEVVNWALPRVTDQDVLDDALIASAYSNHPDVFNRLLEVGANPLAKDNRAIILSTSNKNPIVFNRLRELGADPKAQGGQALRVAIRSYWPETVYRLLEMGLDPSANNNQAILDLIEYSWCNRNIDVVKLAIMKRAPNADLGNVLMVASTKGIASIVKFLLEVQSTYADPMTLNWALYQSAINGYHEVVDLLLVAGADASFQNNRILLEMASTHHDAVVDRLLRAGVSDPDNKALIIAVKEACPGVVRLLLQLRTTPLPLYDSLLMKAVKRIVNRDKVPKWFKCGERSMLYIIGVNYMEVVELLIKAGVDPSTMNSEPLRLAVEIKHFEFVKILLAGGAKVTDDILKIAQTRKRAKILKLINRYQR